MKEMYILGSAVKKEEFLALAERVGFTTHSGIHSEKPFVKEYGESRFIWMQVGSRGVRLSRFSDIKTEIEFLTTGRGDKDNEKFKKVVKGLHEVIPDLRYGVEGNEMEGFRKKIERLSSVSDLYNLEADL